MRSSEADAWQGFTAKEKLVIQYALARLQANPRGLDPDELDLCNRLTNEAWAAWLSDPKAEIRV